MRVLDLGCGSGRDLVSWGVKPSDEVTGLDIDDSCLAIAKLRFSNRTYLQGAGECLPFEDESFDRVISAVALPYMNIHKTLAEIHRILVRGGGLSLSLHLPSFTIAELLHNGKETCGPSTAPWNVTAYPPFVVASGTPLLAGRKEQIGGFRPCCTRVSVAMTAPDSIAAKASEWVKRFPQKSP